MPIITFIVTVVEHLHLVLVHPAEGFVGPPCDTVDGRQVERNQHTNDGDNQKHFD